MLNASAAARADTIIAPTGRLNDPSLGSIFVSAIAADGTGSAGNDVTITPTSGGAALDEQPDPTDADGCSYAFSVVPGTYRVTLSTPGSIDVNQVTSPIATVSVGAGGASSATFQYDAAGTFNITYGAIAAPTRILPTNLSTTYVSGFGPYTSTGTPSVVSLFPFGDGYSAFAGAYVAPTVAGTGCVSVDPSAWAASKVGNSKMTDGARLAPVSAAPGGSAAITAPMGLLSVKAQSGVTAVRIVSTTTTASAGDPGCYTGAIYTYTVPAAQAFLLAAPYGSWTVQAFKNNAWTTLGNSEYTEPSNVGGDIETSLNVVTLDPRALK
jgi:hypothetical protein